MDIFEDGDKTKEKRYKYKEGAISFIPSVNKIRVDCT